MTQENGRQCLSYNFGKELLTVPFDPSQLSMDQNGRVYYPSPKEELGRALVKSSLADELSPFFEFEDGDETRPPRWINWNGQRITLTSGPPLSSEI